MILWYKTAGNYLTRSCFAMDAHGFVACSPVQLVCDILLVQRALFYLTGNAGQFYFIWLYPAGYHTSASILFSTRGHIHRPPVEFLSWLAGLAELIYYNILPLMQNCSSDGPAAARTWILSNFLLSGCGSTSRALLAQSLRRQGVELEVKRSELQDLPCFVIITSSTRCEVGVAHH